MMQCEFIGGPLDGLEKDILDVEEYVFALPMCPETFLALLQGVGPRPEQIFRLYYYRTNGADKMVYCGPK